MFKSVVEKDKYGRNQTRYYLTQGDSCVIYVKPYKNGQALPLDQIEKCVFKVSNEDYKQEFSKDLQVVDDYLKLLLTSQETNKLSVDTHIYELEYTFKGGAVQTTNQWKFIILDQIVE